MGTVGPVQFVAALWLFVLCASAQNRREGDVIGYGDRYLENVDEESWGRWSDPSECSRTCGGGVTYQERRCRKMRPDGGHDCRGPNRVYTTCNIQDCPSNSRDFREIQCEKYNQIQFDEKYYQWVPYYGAEDKCELNCLARGENFFYRHASKVVDGTPCDRDADDICVDGTCQPVGCDGKLGSDKTFDKCYICGGNGTTCRTLQGMIRSEELENGYNDVLLLPVGSTSIDIREHAPSRNFLALRSLSGEYFLNGNWKIAPSSTKHIAGTTFKYIRGSKPSDLAEHITANGPTTQPLFLVILKQEHSYNPAVMYEYSLPDDIKAGNLRAVYRWSPNPWGTCSSTCAGGYQIRTLTCNNQNGDAVADHLCNPQHKPETNQTCNTHPCPAIWHVGFWEKCSRTCGDGIKIRSVFCQQLQMGGNFAIVDSKLCEEDKPDSLEPCNEGIPCPVWEVGPWSRCNAVCGPGEETRQVLCRSKVTLENALSDLLPEERCDKETKPLANQNCFETPCEGVEWAVDEWSGCIGGCEHGYETRMALCVTKNGTVHKDEFCDPIKKPSLERNCDVDEACIYRPKWYASQWSICTAQCGKGIQTRHVACAIQETDGNLKMLPYTSCDPTMKLSANQECTGMDCEGIWFSGPFGKCASPCGGSLKKREVLCFVNGKVAEHRECNSNYKPDTHEDCNLHSCDDDNLLGGCKDSKFGCCPDGVTPAENRNLIGCPAKDPIPRGLCIETEYGCCLDGVTIAEGPFRANCPEVSCKETQYGCCDDGITPAGGPNGLECPANFGCEVTAYGCCPDFQTAAQGPNNYGCPKIPLVGGCASTQFGCCLDGETSATGPGRHGCEDVDGSGDELNLLPEGCGESFYGCCADGVTTATGPHLQGCPGVIITPKKNCNATRYGCCADGVTPALGLDQQGCDGKVEIVDCKTTRYGCCPDGIFIALGPNNEGCPEVGCKGERYGCCPDGVTASEGPDFEGCEDVAKSVSCENTQFGCCPDKVSSARGPNLEGCNITQHVPECDMTSYGCCMDGETVAAGSDFEGCPEKGSYTFTCKDSAYGCCSDGENTAAGPNDAGCPSRIERGAICSLVSDRGSCTNYSVKWYYDSTHGDCSRFWFGGCDGNANKFDNRDGCRESCVSPPGIDKCYLPKSVGRCRATENKFYYNPETQQCEKFAYGGCLGNDNKFDTLEKCEESCVIPQRPDVCKQTYRTGPCRGRFERWFYDSKIAVCRRFLYGGCKGNDNRFETREDCEGRCLESPTKACSKPKSAGPCDGKYDSWYFDTQTKSCQEFVYGGCQGNSNRFSSKQECETTCHELLPAKKDKCAQPVDAGPCKAYYERWHYEKSTGYCKQFIYGGCEGNDNKFDNEEECRLACNAKPPVDVCTLPQVIGPCRASHVRFYFDNNSGQCREFIYGGCDGNGNNFQTLEECEKSCSKNLRPTVAGKEKCSLPKDEGPCLSSMMRWHYDSAAGICKEFEYGGCGGNRNRFLTEDNCLRECRTDGGVSVSRPVSRPVTRPVSPPDNRPVSQPDNRRVSQPDNRRVSQPDTSITTGDSYTTVTDSPTVSDDCMLPEEAGDCTTYQYSWYFNKNSGRCLQFVYGGCGGNGNRFDSEEACEWKCLNKRPSDPEVTGLAVCALHSEPGPCRAATTRWYFDQEQGKCKQFTYGGCRGNENKFRTREECETACPVKEICQLPSESGHCQASKQRYFYDSASNQCVEFRYSGCRGNANRFLNSKNCEKVCKRSKKPSKSGRDVCRLPSDAGTCEKYASNWYFDAASDSCLEFIYGGCGGNGNRFQTRQECEHRCKTPKVTQQPTDASTVGDVCALAKEHGPCRGYFPVWYYEPTTSMCRRFVYGGCDGNGNRFQTRKECDDVCVHRKTSPSYTASYTSTTSTTTTTTTTTSRPSVDSASRITTNVVESATQVDDFCLLKPDLGPCSHYMVQWHFDAGSAGCVRFWYSGCGGNRNRFDSQEHCMALCAKQKRVEAVPVSPIPVLPETCLQTVNIGPCNDTLERWFYMGTNGTCEKFLYGGCDGNANNFESLDECVTTCTPRLPTTMPPLPDGEACTLPPDRGPCQAILKRWYFDTEQEICKDFIFGGCQGNNNNFIVRDLCELVCILPSNKGTDVCALTKDEGPCQAMQSRWYFDQTVQRCAEFSYGGCQGNMNNFKSLKECEEACHKKEEESSTDEAPVSEADTCTMLKDPGPCFADYLRFYFDQDTQECRPFTYGGCQGNKNNYETIEECYHSCGRNIVQHRIYRSGDCFELPDPGPCNNVGPRWHFDSHQGDCVAFYYGGCEGNSNNFRDYDDCVALCSKVSVTCGVLQCNLECPFGFSRGADGCQLCKCDDPCDKFVCDLDQECVVEDVACVKEPCPKPKPVCRPRPKAGECPAFDPQALVDCVTECEQDNDCVGSRLCCDNGCGRVCVEPDLPVNKPGYCPPLDPDMSGICIEMCETDRDCPEYGKCCSNGCGMVCMPAQSTPPESAGTYNSRGRTPKSRDYNPGIRDYTTDDDVGVPLVVTLPPKVPYPPRSTENNRNTPGGAYQPGTRDNTPTRPGHPSNSNNNPDGNDLERHRPLTPSSHDYSSNVWDGPRPRYNGNTGSRTSDNLPNYRPSRPGLPDGRGNNRRNKHKKPKTKLSPTRPSSNDKDQNIWNLLKAGANIDKKQNPSSDNSRRGSISIRNHRYNKQSSNNRNNVPESRSTELGPNSERPRGGVIYGLTGEIPYNSPDRNNPAGWNPRNENTPHYNTNSEESGRTSTGNNFVNNPHPFDNNGRRGLYNNGRGNTDTPVDHNSNGRRGLYNNGRGNRDSPVDHNSNGRRGLYNNGRGNRDSPVDHNSNGRRGLYNNGRGNTDSPVDHNSNGRRGLYNNGRGDRDNPVDHGSNARPATPKYPNHTPTPPGDNYNPSKTYYTPQARDYTSSVPGYAPRIPGHASKVHVYKKQKRCANTVFGCCPDGTTSAGGWNFKGCPEEAPVIDEHPTKMVAVEGETAVIPCVARGAPLPQIDWYKNRFPIAKEMQDDERISHETNGSLVIQDVREDDTALYTCRAFNTLGSSTKTYTLTVTVPVEFMDTPTEVTLKVGETAELQCEATGNPTPEIRWFRGAERVQIHNIHMSEDHDGTLIIENVKVADQGDYECEADNGVGQPVRRTVNLDVLGRITVAIESRNGSYSVGDDVTLNCLVGGDTNELIILWNKNGHALPADDRIKETAAGQLTIKKAVKTDSAEYTCTAVRGEELVSSFYELKVEGVGIPEGCVDKPWYANCRLIVEAKMCRHRYFSDFCCKTCHQAGLLP